MGRVIDRTMLLGTPKETDNFGVQDNRRENNIKVYIKLIHSIEICETDLYGLEQIQIAGSCGKSLSQLIDY
jgi:hypothetical protein